MECNLRISGSEGGYFARIIYGHDAHSAFAPGCNAKPLIFRVNLLSRVFSGQCRGDGRGNDDAIRTHRVEFINQYFCVGDSLSVYATEVSLARPRGVEPL